MAAATAVNGHASSADWDGRYYHVDQILDRPGPRTDPSFLPGAEVSISHTLSVVLGHIPHYHIDQRFPER